MKHLAVILAVTLLPACTRVGGSGADSYPVFDYACSIDGVESFRVSGVLHLDDDRRWPAVVMDTEARTYRYTPRLGEVCAAVHTGEAL